MTMVINDCIMMYHFCVNCRFFGNQSHKIAKVSVGDIDHGGNGEDSLHS